MSTKSHLQVSEYMKRNYPIRLDYSIEDDCWFASYLDLPGCLADGDTREEALSRADEARELWFQAALEARKAIPDPSPALEDEEFSGQFMVRGPSYLHRRLKELADRQHTSMNKLVVAILSAATAVSDLSRLAESAWGAFKVPSLPPFFLTGSATSSTNFIFHGRRIETREEWNIGQPIVVQSDASDDLSLRGLTRP